MDDWDRAFTNRTSKEMVSKTFAAMDAGQGDIAAARVGARVLLDGARRHPSVRPEDIDGGLTFSMMQVIATCEELGVSRADAMARMNAAWDEMEKVPR